MRTFIPHLLRGKIKLQECTKLLLVVIGKASTAEANVCRIISSKKGEMTGVIVGSDPQLGVLFYQFF